MFPKNDLPRLSIALAAAMLLGAGLAACGKTENTATLLAEAKQFQAKGDNKAAVIQLKNAVGKSPEDAEARFALGELYGKINDPVSAEKELRKAKELGVPASRITPALTSALVAQQQFKKAIDESELDSRNGNAELLGARGDAFLALGDADKAKASYEGALAAKPGDAVAMIGLARHALTKGDIGGAHTLIDEAIAKNPASIEALMFKAGLYRVQNDNDKALATYDKVLAIKPDNAASRIEKAYVEIGMRKFDAARADLDAARKAAPGNLSTLYATALLDFSEGKHAAALESLLKVLRVAPEHMPSILLAGAVQFNLGSLPQAEQYLKTYLAKNPGNLYARKLMASTLLAQSRTSDAVSTLATALREAPNDPQLLGLAGDAALQAHDYAKATEYFDKASKLQPDTATLHTSLAISKLAQGDSERAVSELEASTKLDGASTKAGILLTLTELRLKHYDKALAAANAMEKANPKDPMVANLKGGVYLGKNDPVNARANFDKALVLNPGYFPAVSNLAQMALKDKKPAEAKALYLAFLEKDKKNIDALTALANLAATEGKQDEVTQWLEKASAENPDAVAPAMRLIRHNLALGGEARQKGLLMARKFAVANPGNVDLVDLLGQAQLSTGDKSGALDSYSKLTGLAPKSALAQFRLAEVHAALGNESAAGDDLKKAVALQPDYLDAQLAQIQLAMRAKKPELALAVAKLVQKQRPKEPTGFMLEADVLQAQGKLAPALAALNQAAAVGKPPALLIKQYGLLTQMGNEKEADARLAQWRRERPDDMMVALFAAQTNLTRKQFKPAIAQLEDIIKREPRNAAALNNLAWVYQQEKDPRALKTAEQAYQLADKAPAVMDTYGLLLVEQGDAKRGLALLQQASALAPQSAEIRFHLAQAQAKTGDAAGARKQLEQLVDDKTFTQAEAARAMLKSM
jgi:putative PEP-CTERM system TPR-repeat lipoprotein